MSTTLIQLEIKGKRAVLTLQRPHKANALNREMVTDLTRAVVGISANQQVHTLLVRGAGNRAFCAGADLTEAGTMQDEGLWKALSDTLLKLPVLSVALINGACIGGGLALALGCDIRIGVAHATFGYPVLRNGLMPGKADVTRLNAITGTGRTAMILLGGQKISAAEALQWGLLERIVPKEALESEGETISQVACDVERGQVIKVKQRLRQEEN